MQTDLCSWFWRWGVGREMNIPVGLAGEVSQKGAQGERANFPFMQEKGLAWVGSCQRIFNAVAWPSSAVPDGRGRTSRLKTGPLCSATEKEHVGALQLFPLLEPRLLLVVGCEWRCLTWHYQRCGSTYELSAAGRAVRVAVPAEREKLPGKTETTVLSSGTSHGPGRNAYCLFPAGHSLTPAKAGTCCSPSREAEQEQLSLHSAHQRKRRHWTPQVGVWIPAPPSRQIVCILVTAERLCPSSSSRCRVRKPLWDPRE